MTGIIPCVVLIGLFCVSLGVCEKNQEEDSFHPGFFDWALDVIKYNSMLDEPKFSAKELSGIKTWIWNFLKESIPDNFGNFLRFLNFEHLKNSIPAALETKAILLTLSTNIGNMLQQPLLVHLFLLPVISVMTMSVITFWPLIEMVQQTIYPEVK